MSTAVEPALPTWTLRLLSELEAADRRARSVAKGLSAEQLNRQPRPGAWGIGQCLEHLYISNEVYLPAISAALEGQPHATVQEVKLGWCTRWFIRNYIAPNPKGTRGRAPRKIEPSKRVEPSILEVFLRSNQAARELLRRASAYDVNRVRFKNPFIPMLRFTVGAGLEIITQHQSRHLLQAEGVNQSLGFRQYEIGSPTRMD